MTIQQAQLQVNEWITTKGVRYFSELTNMAVLAEEVGEVARHMARIYGDQSYKKEENTYLLSTEDGPNGLIERKEHLGEELADVLWVLLCIANQTGINLTEAFHKNLQKKNLRDTERHQQNKKLK
ncbi:MAG: nucleotide pyrophosphohydrolase [Chitinophagaceae bacterium]